MEAGWAAATMAAAGICDDMTSGRLRQMQRRAGQSRHGAIDRQHTLVEGEGWEGSLELVDWKVGGCELGTGRCQMSEQRWNPLLQASPDAQGGRRERGKTCDLTFGVAEKAEEAVAMEVAATEGGGWVAGAEAAPEGLGEGEMEGAARAGGLGEGEGAGEGAAASRGCALPPQPRLRRWLR